MSRDHTAVQDAGTADRPGQYGMGNMSGAHRMADAYARYAGLIAAQLQALDRDAFDEVSLLGAQRERLASEIEALQLDGAGPDALEEIHHGLAACMEADAELRIRLDRHREASMIGARRANRWRMVLRRFPDGRLEAPADGRPATEAPGTGFPAGTLPPDRVRELRRRIRARRYDDPQVIDEMLRRMVERGDL
jgi:hypothetical protein